MSEAASSVLFPCASCSLVARSSIPDGSLHVFQRRFACSCSRPTGRFWFMTTLEVFVRSTRFGKSSASARIRQSAEGDVEQTFEILVTVDCKIQADLDALGAQSAAAPGATELAVPDQKAVQQCSHLAAGRSGCLLSDPVEDVERAPPFAKRQLTAVPWRAQASCTAKANGERARSRRDPAEHSLARCAIPFFRELDVRAVDVPLPLQRSRADSIGGARPRWSQPKARGREDGNGVDDAVDPRRCDLPARRKFDRDAVGWKGDAFDRSSRASTERKEEHARQEEATACHIPATGRIRPEVPASSACPKRPVRSRRMRLLVARCEVLYTGRLTARLPEAVRLLIPRLVHASPWRDALAVARR